MPPERGRPSRHGMPADAGEPSGYGVPPGYDQPDRHHGPAWHGEPDGYDAAPYDDAAHYGDADRYEAGEDDTAQYAAVPDDNRPPYDGPVHHDAAHHDAAPYDGDQYDGAQHDGAQHGGAPAYDGTGLDDATAQYGGPLVDPADGPDNHPAGGRHGASPTPSHAADPHAGDATYDPEPDDHGRSAEPRPVGSGAMPDPYSQMWTEGGQHADGRSAEKRTRQKALRLGAVGVVAAVVIGLLLAIGLRSLRSDDTAQIGPATPTEAAAAGEEHSPTNAGPVDLFAGTPAAGYARDAAGITPPAAKAVGEWSSKDVADVGAKVKTVLAAGRLNSATLEKGDLTQYLNALAPGVRSKVQGDIGKGQPALGYVTRLSPDTKLASRQVRVKGSMRAAVGPDKQLVITADYVWVYPLAPTKPVKPSPSAPASAAPGSHLVLVHTVEKYEWYKPMLVDKQERGLRPGAGELYTFNMDCTAAARGMLALAPPGQKGKPAPDNRAYDPNTKTSSLPTTC